jgi:hypothetical protein
VSKAGTGLSTPDKSPLNKDIDFLLCRRTRIKAKPVASHRYVATLHCNVNSEIYLKQDMMTASGFSLFFFSLIQIFKGC